MDSDYASDIRRKEGQARHHAAHPLASWQGVEMVCAIFFLFVDSGTLTK